MTNQDKGQWDQIYAAPSNPWTDLLCWHDSLWGIQLDTTWGPHVIPTFVVIHLINWAKRWGSELFLSQAASGVGLFDGHIYSLSSLSGVPFLDTGFDAGSWQAAPVLSILNFSLPPI